MIVAEQVVAALEGGLVTNAVNIPVVDAADLEMLGPFIPLAAKLGRLAVELEGELAEADRGRRARAALRVRHAAAHRRRAERRLPGPRRPGRQLRERAGDRRRARDRGRGGALPRLARLHEPRRGAHRRRSPSAGRRSGRSRGSSSPARSASAIDIELAPNLVFLRYTDMPGVIGRVGTMFGEHGVNIANMAVSRTHEAGKALMAFAIDAPAPPELVERIHAEGFDDAWFISPSGVRSTASDRSASGVGTLPAVSPLRVAEAWPEPVERVSAALREAGAEARIEEFADGDAHRRGRRRARRLRAASDRQVAASSTATARRCSCSSRATAAPTRPRSPRRPAPRRARVAGAEQVEAGDRLRARRRLHRSRSRSRAAS